MAVGFGFSVSDICLGITIIKDSIGAVHDTKGASADYRALITEIDSLKDGLEAVQELQIDERLSSRQSAALEKAVGACQGTVEDFLASVSKYRPHLNPNAKGFVSGIRKIKWALCKKDDLAKFRAQIGRHASSINMLLITFQTRESFNATTSMEGVQADNDNHLAKLIISLTVEQRECFMVIIQQNQELMQSVQEMQKMLQIHAKLPPQVLLQQPVVLLDPFGKVAPFHLEFISSPECFLAVLKARFNNAGVTATGLSKLDSHEFLLEDRSRKKSIDLSKRWESVFRSGQQVEMSMVFHRFFCPPSTCPACMEVNEDGDEQIICQACGLCYQNVQAISKQSGEWNQHFPIGGEELPYILRRPSREPELKVFRPTDDTEDELFEGYRRVQIISQSLALLDARFPALQLIEDFCRFAELLHDIPFSISPYRAEIDDLHSRARIYVLQHDRSFPAFSPFAYVEQMRRRMTQESSSLRHDVDTLIKNLCSDKETRDLVKHIKQKFTAEYRIGYYTNVLTRMVALWEFAQSRDGKSVKAKSSEKMEWMMLDNGPTSRTSRVSRLQYRTKRKT